MTLYELAITILALSPAPISKVRFAKTIYFAHKELIRKKIMKSEDIAYLRLPLGPVPEGFMSLSLEHPEIRSRRSAGALSYEAEEYLLDLAFERQAEHQKAYDVVQKVLIALATHPTSELVRSSHDPSWLAHRNGERYFLTATDLKNTYPFLVIRINLPPILFGKPATNEAGALQATLLRGMLKDIVKESTDLEYPDENPKTPKSSAKSSAKPTRNHEKSPGKDASTPDSEEKIGN